jgi:ssDNA-binding Zn-finger/Zn-ribbon topoisomerase 1
MRIRSGYDTERGRVVVCENYPKCSYLKVIGRKVEKEQSK